MDLTTHRFGLLVVDGFLPLLRVITLIVRMTLAYLSNQLSKIQLFTHPRFLPGDPTTFNLKRSLVMGTGY